MIGKYIFDDIKENYPMLRQLYYYTKGIDGFIAGGCFRSIFDGENPKDVDVFFKTAADWDNAVKYYLCNGWKRIYENESVTGFYKKGFCRVDLVRSIFGSPGEILIQFDFSVAKFAMDREKVYFLDSYWRDLHLKRLVCDFEIPKPIGTFNRAQKYAQYGYFMCRETKLKLLRAIMATNQADIESLDKSLYRGWD